MKKTLLSTITILALMSTMLYADEITEQINEAVKAYEEKDYKGAIEELKYAVAQLEELKSNENSKLLPKALDGWKFKETKGDGTAAAMAMFGGGGGSSMTGQYTKEEERVDIEITANSPMMGMMNMAISNPAMISSDPSMKLYRYKRIKGVKKTEKDSIEITLLLSSQLMIKVKGSNLKDEKILKEYLDGMDMKKIKEELL